MPPLRAIQSHIPASTALVQRLLSGQRVMATCVSDGGLGGGALLPNGDTALLSGCTCGCGEGAQCLLAPVFSLEGLGTDPILTRQYYSLNMLSLNFKKLLVLLLYL